MILALFMHLQKTTAAQGNNDSQGMSSFSLALHPLGALQFGPLLEAEFGIARNATIGLNFRYPSLGLLFQAANDFEMTWGCFAFGTSFKYYFPNETRKSRWYLGTLLQYQIDHSAGDEGTTDEWKGNGSGIVWFLNAGYRFRYQSGFFLNLGVIGGTYFNLKDKWWYTKSPDKIYDDGGFVRGAIMLELGLGFEFGK